MPVEPVLHDMLTAADSLSSTSTGGLRRIEDYERLSKLEYIVADHHIDIQALKTELDLVRTTSLETVQHLKAIKYILGSFLAGLLISNIGVERTIVFIKNILGLGVM